MSNEEALLQEAKAATDVRLFALDRALRIHTVEEEVIRIAKMFEAYLNGEG